MSSFEAKHLIDLIGVAYFAWGWFVSPLVLVVWTLPCWAFGQFQQRPWTAIVSSGIMIFCISWAMGATVLKWVPPF